MVKKVERCLGEALAQAVMAAAKGNSQTSVPVAAVLWPDRDGAWTPGLVQLQQRLPDLFVVGAYDPEHRTGPAIWLKTAISGALPEVAPKGVPVIYLPGVSRAELRAIESCPRDLQPLAELQYRGVFWSQANAKDWTLSAFLSSKNGGLELDVAQDKATQEALRQALEAGVLLDRPVAELQGVKSMRSGSTASWLRTPRDLLLWMNDADSARAQWAGVRWDVFSKRCKADFGFDPVADGLLVAAELLAKGKGKWAAVSELYRDSYTSFPKVYDLLLRSSHLSWDCSTNSTSWQAIPRPTKSGKRTCAMRWPPVIRWIRHRLVQPSTKPSRSMGAVAVGCGGAWGNPLAVALGHLSRLVELSTNLPSGSSPEQLAASYQQHGWQVDAAALDVLAAVQAKADVDAVSAALRSVYRPWLDAAAVRLQEAAKSVGGLPP
jgi:hypothetical protein